MATWSLTKAPSWAKDAVATNRGWVNPENGDILVSCKRLENAVDYIEEFGSGVSAKSSKGRGGARTGAGRKTDAQRAQVAKEKLDNGTKLSAGEAKALLKVEGINVEPKQVQKPKKTRKPAKAKAKGKKGIMNSLKGAFTSKSEK